MQTVRLTSFTQATIELRRLRSLWLTLQFGFEAATAEVRARVKGDKKVAASPLHLATGDKKKVSESHYDFLNRSKSQMPRYAREVIFVRLISTLEVFLVDLVRDLFLHNPELFHDQQKMLRISHAELLATDDLSRLRNRLINGELRQLHSNGIKETAKYYDARLGLGFANLGINLNVLWEMVDRRHLLVHRLGRADEPYRRQYGYDKKAALSVEAPYLLAALDLIDDFVARMEARVTQVIAPSPDRSKEEADRLDLRLDVQSASTEGDLALRPTFAFVIIDRDVGERAARLGDILVSDHMRDDGGHTLTVSGTTDETDGFVRELKKRQKRGLLTYAVVGKTRIKVRVSSRKESKLSREMLQAVAVRLPKEPWPTGIHKLIAAELSISNSDCSRAITTIRGDQALWAIVGSQTG